MRFGTCSRSNFPLRRELPPDGIAAGFDNIGDALSMSPLLLEQYLKVARKVSELAVGVSDPSPVTENFPAPEAQASWLGEGLPFGTRGGIRVQYYFPHDGEYSSAGLHRTAIVCRTPKAFGSSRRA